MKNMLCGVGLHDYSWRLEYTNLPISTGFKVCIYDQCSRCGAKRGAKHYSGDVLLRWSEDLQYGGDLHA